LFLSRRFGQIDNENKLLRREVAALTDEVSSFATRMRSTQATLQDTRGRLAASERKVTKVHGGQRDEQQRAQRLQDKMDQQATGMQALEDRLMVAEQHVIDLQAEKEIILKDHADSGAAHDGALTSLRTELEALKSAKAVTQGSLEASKSATEEQLGTLRTTHASIERRLHDVTADATAKAAAVQKAATRTALLEQQLAGLRTEFADYRTKAGQILQKKEKELGALRTGGGGATDSSGGSGDLTTHQLLEEQARLQEELATSEGLVEQLRADLRELEQQTDEDSELAASQIGELELALSAASAAKAAGEQESTRRVQELVNQLEEVERQRVLLSQEAQRGAAELQQVQSEVARLSHTTEGRATAELEEKLRALTGNVVRKQSQIEALSSDKNSLALQVEELERQKVRSVSLVMLRRDDF
jgi:chromosome segregation ATPase